MPKLVELIAWLVPVTSAIDIARELMIGKPGPKIILEMLYLLIAFLITAEYALRSLRRRLVS
jgi:ABC-type uncharacterized transport system permease subunit